MKTLIDQTLKELIENNPLEEENYLLEEENTAVQYPEGGMSLSQLMDTPPENNYYLTKKQLYGHLDYEGNDRLCFDARNNLSIIGINIDGEVSIIQTIRHTGKYNKKNSKLRGSFHPIGCLESAKAIFLCEGWATALSLYHIIKILDQTLLHKEIENFAVLCCFGFVNIFHVKEAIDKAYPWNDVFIAPDRDKNEDEKIKKEEKVLLLDGTLPEKINDWSDFHLAFGMQSANIFKRLMLKQEKMGRFYLAEKINSDVIFQNPKVQEFLSKNANKILTWSEDYYERRFTYSNELPSFFTPPVKSNPTYANNKYLFSRESLLLRASKNEHGDLLNLEMFEKGEWTPFFVTVRGKPTYLVIIEATTGFCYKLELSQKLADKKLAVQDLFNSLQSHGLTVSRLTPRIFEEIINSFPFAQIPSFNTDSLKGWSEAGGKKIFWINNDTFVSKEISKIHSFIKIERRDLPEWAEELIQTNPIFFLLFSHIGYYCYEQYAAFKEGNGFKGGHVISITGASGSGKTTLGLLLNKLIGKDDFDQMSATVNSIIEALEHEDLLFLDESESVMSDFAKSTKIMSYQISSGKGKRRFGRQSATFASAVITTGERPILTEDSMAGQFRRVVQLTSREPYLEKNECARILNLAKICDIRGTIIEEIPFLVVDDLDLKFEGVHEDISHKLNKILSYGVSVAKQVFNLDIKLDIQKGLSKYLKNAREIDPLKDFDLSQEERRFVYKIVDIYQDNKASIYHQDELKNADQFQHQRMLERLVGVIKKDDFFERKETVCIDSSKFRCFEKEFGRDLTRSIWESLQKKRVVEVYNKRNDRVYIRPPNRAGVAAELRNITVVKISFDLLEKLT